MKPRWWMLLGFLVGLVGWPLLFFCLNLFAPDVGAAVIRVDVDTVAVTASVVPTCGDGKCNGAETNASCPSDCPATTPATPTSLSATAASSSQVNLAWTDNATNETGVKVERSPGGAGAWALITTTASDATSYQNTSLIASTTYDYRVRATNGAGDSTNSTTASATTQAASGCSAPRFFPFGDSLTQGVDDSPQQLRDGWIKRLQTVLLTQTYDWVGRYHEPSGVTWDVDDSGEGGLTALKSLDPAYAAQYYGGNGTTDTWLSIELALRLPTPNPACSVMTVMLGTNDAIQNLPVADTVTRILTIIDRIDAWDSTVPLAIGIPPPGNAADPTQQAALRAWLQTYHDQLLPALQTRQATKSNLVIADHHAAFLANPNWPTEWMGAGVHPSTAGYSKMADVWKAVIQP